MIVKNDRWKLSVIGINSTIKDVIVNLNEVGNKLSIAVDNFGCLLGTISDGDVRRAILNGFSLNDSVLSVIQKKPITIKAPLDKDQIIDIMVQNKIQQIPLVDHNNKVVGLYTWEDLVKPPIRENVVVIMAGGRGTRLHPYTIECPKPMLKVGDKPIAQHILERCKSQGFYKFVISINYLGNLIAEYFGDGSRFGVQIEYINESHPLGTAGSLGLLNHGLADSIVVTNGDILSDISFADILDYHESHDAMATMAVREYELANPFGVVELDGYKIIDLKEKPIYKSYINSGIYALNPNALDFLVKDVYCDMPNLFKALQEVGHLTIAYPLHERWMDIGRPDDLISSRNLFRENND